ncbi:MAG: gliding motility protein GldN [Bacteroidota bacterium]
MKKFLVSVLVIANLGASYAQQEINGGPINVPSENIIDGVYIKEHIPTKRLIPYEFVREADVIWSKRVWRTIDLREKINHPLYFPFDEYLNQNKPNEQWVRNSTRWSLWTVIKHHVMNSDLTMFSVFNPYNIIQDGNPDGDLFKYPVRPETGKNYFTDSLFKNQVDERFATITGSGFRPVPSKIDGTDSVTIEIDPATGMEIEVGVNEPYVDKEWIVSKDIVSYELKEDWFFDKERSVMDVRILGICPVIYEATKEGGKYKELFWLYFPNCRFVFNNYFSYNTKNDAQWVSFDDLFWKRQFSSYIYKESNVFERKIDSYRTGVDALRESEKITEEIRNIEHDVWHF